MKLEKIVIRNSRKDYYGQVQNYDSSYFFITKKEVEDLRTWLLSSQVSFKGFKGKVYFHQNTQFPRYKFTEYSRNNNKIVRRVKSIQNADVVVIDIESYKQALDYVLRSNEEHILDLGILLGDKQVYNKSNTQTSLTRQGLLLYHKDVYNDLLESLVELYNTKNTLKTVSVYELNEVITKTGNILNSEMSDQLKNLLNSNDSQSIKLAMEIMTNCDFESSLFHIVLLCSLYGQKMINNQYWNSTAFKAFRNNLYRLNLQIEYLRGNNTIDAVQKFLSIKDKYIFEDDIDFIKKCIRSEIDETYSLSETGFALDKYDIILNIDPNKIIKREIETSEEETEELIEETN